MLSDHEWKTLREVERRLLTEDPEFTRSFDTRAQRLLGGSDRWGLQIFLVTGLLLSALMLVTGSLSGAVAFAAATGIVYHDRDRAEFAFYAVHGRVEGGGVLQVDFHGEDLLAVTANLRGQAFEPVPAAGQQGQTGATMCEAAGKVGAQSARGPGDNGRLAFKIACHSGAPRT